MDYTDYSETLDIDWFALDTQGYIIHIASGGDNLPDSIKKNMEDNESVTLFFNSLGEISNEVSINDKIFAQKGINNEVGKSRYLESFIRYTKRGLFSFDKTNIDTRYDHRYVLVAKPIKKINAKDLPNKIIQILSRTVLNIDITGAEQISISQILKE